MVFPIDLSYYIFKILFEYCISETKKTEFINKKNDKIERILFSDKQGQYKSRCGYYDICHCDNCHKIYWERESKSYSYCINCNQDFCDKCIPTLKEKPVHSYDTYYVCKKCYYKPCFKCNSICMGLEVLCIAGCNKIFCDKCEIRGHYSRNKWYCEFCKDIYNM
jgi:hypothetical protein